MLLQIHYMDDVDPQINLCHTNYLPLFSTTIRQTTTRPSPNSIIIWNISRIAFKLNYAAYISLSQRRRGPICDEMNSKQHCDILKYNKSKWHTYIHTYIHTYLLLLISMLWHRQAIFKSKGDKLCSSAQCRIWTRGPRHQIASRPNARWQTNWAIEDQAKNLNSTARPYDQRAIIRYSG